jgi:hypothetical protein
MNLLRQWRGLSFEKKLGTVTVPLAGTVIPITERCSRSRASDSPLMTEASLKPLD